MRDGKSPSLSSANQLSVSLPEGTRLNVFISRIETVLNLYSMNRCFHMYVFIISSVFQLGLHVNSHCSSPHLISPEFADAEVASGNMAWQQAVQDPESVENSHWMADSPILVGGFKSSEKYECQLG